SPSRAPTSTTWRASTRLSGDGRRTNPRLHLDGVDPALHRRREPGPRAQARADGDDAAVRRDEQGAEDAVVHAQVRAAGQVAEDLRDVVETDEAGLVVEEEDLRRGVGREAGRIGDLQAAQPAPRLDLARREARPGEVVGREDVVPERVAEEVEEVELVP